MMKRCGLILIFLFSILFAPGSSRGAVTFNGSTSYLSMADNNAIAIPNAQFAFSCWVKLVSNAGTVTCMRILNWNIATGGEFSLCIGNASGASEVNDTQVYWTDDTAHTQNHSGLNDNSWASNTSWTNVIFQREASNSVLYINNVAKSTLPNGSMSSYHPATDFRFGANRLGASVLNGAEAECAFWNGKSLDANQRAAIQKGFSPRCFPNSINWHVSMIRDHVEIRTGIALTAVNSPTITDHPRTIYCQ